MAIEETTITGAKGIENSDHNPAFGCEISLKYLKKQEWVNLESFTKNILKKIGSTIDTIQQDGPNSSVLESIRIHMKFSSLRHDSRFYKAIKCDIDDFCDYYEFKYSDKIRMMMSFTKIKGYLVCFDHNHSALALKKDK